MVGTESGNALPPAARDPTAHAGSEVVAPVADAYRWPYMWVFVHRCYFCVGKLLRCSYLICYLFLYYNIARVGFRPAQLCLFFSSSLLVNISIPYWTVVNTCCIFFLNNKMQQENKPSGVKLAEVASR